MAIYRDQLEEVDRDVVRGVIAESEAGAARTEIARRLIRAGETPPASAAGPGRLPTIAAALIVAMPVAALGLYLLLGSPHDPDQPLSARQEAVALQDVTKLVAAVEAHLAAAPDDGKGWEVIAPVYARLGRYADAVRAYSVAISILGSTPEREAGLGEARTAMIEGMVASLAARLKSEPGDADGWARLVRSYMVLDRAADAEAAVAQARGALAGDAAKLAEIDAAVRELGLSEARQ